MVWKFCYNIFSFDYCRSLNHKACNRAENRNITDYSTNRGVAIVYLKEKSIALRLKCIAMCF